MLAGDYESLTSEKTWSVLKDMRERKVLVFGSGSEDETYCTSAGWSLASIEDATLLLARGTFTICNGDSVLYKNHDETHYNRILYETLVAAARKNIPMLVTNPDKIRPDEGLPPMPGAIGDLYAKMLDSSQEAQSLLLKRIGKPFTEVYDLALRGRTISRACMIGDALETDITGGQNYGIDTIWIVKDGIHGPDVNNKGNNFEDDANDIINQFNEKTNGTYADGQKLSPTYILKHFRW
jgi:ribonucleotide monophosphatase NagD (HAD superfamily)